MTKTMRVAVYYSNSDIRIENRPIPKIGPGELLMKIFASGVCGSDVMEWYRIHKAPLVLGHEVAGEVAEVGEGAGDFSVGDRIVVSHHVPCLVCDNCRNGHETVCDTLFSTNFDPGGFCEYLRVPAINVRNGTYLIPDGVSFDEACFAEPMACVLRGQLGAGVGPGKSVLVLGSGISGIGHIHLACALGAGPVVATDVDPWRIAAARRFGAAQSFLAKDYTPDEFRRANGGRLADVVITTAGARPVFEQAFASVARGGVILIFAPTMPGETIPLPVNDLFWKTDLTITTTYAGSPADHVMALRMIGAGRLKVEDMITHRFGLADTTEAFQKVAVGTDSIKVIVHPHK
jgi:L-iditol 2-dehydrogenase